MTDLRIDPLFPVAHGVEPRRAPDAGESFGDVMNKAIDRVECLEKTADSAIMDMLNGKAGVHEAMVAIQKADVSVRMFLAVRNKAIEAYREIMRMQF